MITHFYQERLVVMNPNYLPEGLKPDFLTL